MESIKENTPEYLSKDILDDDFLEIFLSVYRLQYIMGSCRVHTKNRFVTPPTALQKCYTVLLIVLTCGSIYSVKYLYLDLLSNKTVVTLDISMLLTIFSASFCNIINARFLNGRQNTEFLVKMQKLDRLMKINKKANTIQNRTNGLTVLLISLGFVSLIVVTCITEEYNALVFTGMGMSFFSFLAELIVCSSIVVYFLIRVRLVNFMIEGYLDRVESCRNPLILRDEKCFRFIMDDSINDFITSDTHIYLKEIFSCFTMFQDLYKFQLLLFCTKLVVLSVISFEIVLYSSSNSTLTLAQLSSVILFMIIDSLIAIFLAFRFGIFFAEVKETKRLCIAVMAVHQEGALRDKAKTMLNIIEETPPRFSVYGMWDMSAGVFVTIFSLVTSFIVTLIQFQYL